MGRNGQGKGFTDLFRRVTSDEMKYLRMAIYGAPGSGKTRTATEIAIGICKDLAGSKPIAFIDTERAVDWVTGIVEAQGIELMACSTDDFEVMLDAIDVAEHEAGCIIVDSLSRFWLRIQEEFLEAHPNRDGYIAVQDWGIIKPVFRRFTQKMLNAETHIITCGRMSGVYEERVNERGKKVLVQVDEKMKAEPEFEHEPSLVVKMKLVEDKETTGGNKRHNKSKDNPPSAVINRAIVLKDRSDSMEGAIIDNPTYGSFKPFIEKLAPNGRRIALHESIATGKLFGAADPEEARIRAEKLDMGEELKAAFDLAGLGGNTGDAKQRKAELCQEAFGTPSGKEAWKKCTLKDLKFGVALIKHKLGQGSNPADIDDDLPDMTVGDIDEGGI